MKVEIESNVDYNPNNYAKAMFYADEEVMAILDKLYERWEEHGRKGVPLDYATIDELRVLYYKSRLYRDATGEDLISVAIYGTSMKERMKKRRKGSSGLRHLLSLFIGRWVEEE
ncbi:MAG: hypothetical protein DRO12_01850 [Thermoprotei archaeon]|nr:MAG: hypothetical protein DRO12_01850 [Thermoprotei archaeon]